jgi:four helix bundle protein
MALFHNLQAYHHSQRQVRAVAELTKHVRFGDLANQMRRAAISVVSNLVEGNARTSHRDAVRLLSIARASNDEPAAQLDIVDLTLGIDTGDVRKINESTGRLISGVIRWRSG